MPTSGSGTGTPISTVPPAGVGGGGTGTSVLTGCATTLVTGSNDCLCRHCMPESAYTSLEAWRLAMSCVEPWQFWGWDNAGLRDLRAKACQDIVQEWTHHGMLGRRELRQALLRSEAEFLSKLGYSPVLAWFSEQLPPAKKLQTKSKFVTKVGAPVRTVLGTAQREAQAITFTTYAGQDNEGDVITFSARQAGAKWPDRFTVTVARPSGLNDASEVALYIYPDDRYEQKSNHARWRIEPIDVTLTNAAIIISGRSWLLAKPELYDVYAPHPKPVSAFGNDYSIDPSYMPNYVERLEVARLTVNECAAGLVRTESLCQCGGCTCTFDDDGVPTHCHACEPIDLCIDNAQYGHIRPLWTQFDGWNNLICRDNPKSICIHYQAGDCTKDWTQPIAVLATTYLHGVCECSFPCLARWWDDWASGENKQNTFETLNNPYGTLAGFVETWRTIERHRTGNVVSW